MIDMRHSNEEFLATKAAEKIADYKRNEQKGRIGEDLIASTSKRIAGQFGCNSEGEENVPAQKKQNSKSVQTGPFMLLGAFCSNMRESNLARKELESENLQFERERSEADILKRDLEREERREERERNQELQLAK